MHEETAQEFHPAPDNVDSLKVPPHSVEAEQAVLGGLLLDNNAWDQVADRVTEEDFYRQDHRLIFRAIAALAERGEPFDVITLSEFLEPRGELEKAGGLVYLGTLAKDTPSASNIKAYADIVRERAILRNLIGVAGEIADDAFNPNGRDSREILDEAERKVFQIAEMGARGQQGFQPLKHLVKGAVEFIDAMHEKQDGMVGIPTGYDDLDKLTSGLQAGDLIIVAGRPSMGKTSFAMNLAEYAAMKSGKAAAIFSMEMPGEQLAIRMLSSLGRINQQRLRTGKLRDDDWPRLTSAVELLAGMPLFIDDTPALTPTEVRARARRLVRSHGELGLIMIDYLQLMQVAGSSENRATEISEISRSLKALAKELNVALIALSQLNRSLEQRPNKRPVMSDLRESGAIEQDADVIMFIYRDEVYNEESPDKGVAEIIIGKQRNGPIGTVRLTFLGQYTRFENFTPDVYSSMEGGGSGYAGGPPS
ncbi:MAG TPA: replicative DNA helicase [Gammaproteobacteria bacterium]|nr:replicative DNA helicase [Gammaproteobacteria bacterium]